MGRGCLFAYCQGAQVCGPLQIIVCSMQDASSAQFCELYSCGQASQQRSWQQVVVPELRWSAAVSGALLAALADAAAQHRDSRLTYERYDEVLLVQQGQQCPGPSCRRQVVLLTRQGPAQRALSPDVQQAWPQPWQGPLEQPVQSSPYGAGERTLRMVLAQAIRCTP